MRRWTLVLIALSVGGFLAYSVRGQAPAPDKIKLPPGFSIAIYANSVRGARSMTLGTNGTLFVGTGAMQRGGPGEVFAVVDRDKNNSADQVITIAKGLNMPNGVAFHNGALYVAEVNRILRYDNIESRLNNPPPPVVIKADLPSDFLHGWKFIAFGPDGMLYVPIGAPCNVCRREDQRYASITRMRPDGSAFEIFARGVRNTVGFDWHPQTRELWFTDNGRDNLGDNIPPDELNRVPSAGLHFGFPNCHAGTIKDPEFGQDSDCAKFTPPAINLSPHGAAIGMRFYTGSMFPPEYRNQIFVAEHGSWNRSQKIGYRVALVRVENNRAVRYEAFAEGWLEGQRNWGRPADVQVMPDGALLVSDDQANVIYRISYAR